VGKNKSPFHQALWLFEHGNFIGESRHQAKLDGSAEYKFFHSTTFRSSVGILSRKLEFVREKYGVRQFRDLTPEHVRAFIASLHERGLAPSTIQKYISVIQKADTIAKRIGWRDADAPPLLQLEPKGPKIGSVPRPYSSSEVNEIIQIVNSLRDRRFPAMAQIQRYAGLRVSEVAHLTVSAVSHDGAKLSLTARDGTKKGRPRVIHVTDPPTQKMLAEWRQTAIVSGRARLFIQRASHAMRLVRAYQRAVQQAAEKLSLGHSKTHDIRRTFAVERYREYIEQNLSKTEALARLSEDLGHGRSRMERGLLASYLPPDDS
jgi:site-specific recombinase XerD